MITGFLAVLLYKRQSPVGVYTDAARLEGPFAARPAAAAFLLSQMAERINGGASHAMSEGA
ncbi:hypothetical protein GCM10010329_62340 [Streptomyces spiroverticillatus]|uniref:Uncharacterized protein n=1 Tax=Streptomyces finlayi TaxID=67296 RepID=A0A918X6S8_9ACTN|nr:hypothetical protein [Streptomyces finlayi]GHA30545.1 hypothetical protein GCM10010329_62340 [Streptomyces spiroverticillatus]GHD14727.1 hypothetical protein GCM10010334_74090 [Streptomyces finlayi]